MTQFIRIRPGSAAGEPQEIDTMRERLESISGVVMVADPSGWLFVVDVEIHASGDHLADDLYNRIFNHEPIELAPLVRLVHLIAESGWELEAWYSDYDADLPTYSDADAAIRDIVVQTSTQPPEVYVRLLPRAREVEHKMAANKTELASELRRLVRPQTSLEDVFASLSDFKKLGGTQAEALEVLEQLRAESRDDETQEDSILEMMDIASGWCNPRFRVWP
jgi:hypothetical protein